MECGPAYKRDGAWFVTVSVLDQDRYEDGPMDFGDKDEHGSLDRVIGALARIREMIPEEYRTGAMCGIHNEGGYGDSYSISISVRYERPATEAEIATARNWEKEDREVVEANERATLARLKKKYGD